MEPLGDRMKRYEAAASPVLPWRLPVVVRVDGKAFHTWTRGLERPWSAAFSTAMDSAALLLCKEMQGARLAFVQSDEISVLLWPWRTVESMPWFDNQLSKIVSVAAGLASAEMTLCSELVHGGPRRAVFDARAFAIPESDVANYFVWRQQDAERNSLLGLTQAHYSHREMHGAKKAQMHDLLHAKGVNWNDLPTEQKRGRCIRRSGANDMEDWIVDREIPIFTQAREYIEGHLWRETKQEAEVRA